MNNRVRDLIKLSFCARKSDLWLFRELDGASWECVFAFKKQDSGYEQGRGTGGAEGAAAPPVFFCGQL